LIAIASDHGGFNLKRKIVGHLISLSYDIKDLGTDSNEPVDYPDYGLKVCEEIVSGVCEKGILICGTGIGISIAANKVNGIRAALCQDCYSARMSREHNDANVLALGERVLGEGLALEIVDVWLNTGFLGGIHKIRVEKINEIEKKSIMTQLRCIDLADKA
jgi:ribose 5-phosphate isomerase B